jgi:hypothetical protein
MENETISLGYGFYFVFEFCMKRVILGGSIMAGRTDEELNGVTLLGN